MTVEQIISSWKKKEFKPIYWFEGEEDYFIDQLTNYAEDHILTEQEASFNLSVYYGKDIDVNTLLQACRKYPMFSDRQLVILKEAQQLKEIENLLAYVKDPLLSTIFIVAHKQKTLDKRKTLSKSISSAAVYYHSVKISEDKLGKWITDLVKSKKLEIKPRSVTLIEEHIGNDLGRISNEIDKIAINLDGRTLITDQDIENYIGINKEYNIYELFDALAFVNPEKAFKILYYFDKNPKAAPHIYLLATLYAQVSKVYVAYGLKDKSASALDKHFWKSAQQSKAMMQHYGFEGVQKILLLLHNYNLKRLGVGDQGNTDAALLKEMVSKIFIRA